MLPHQAEALKRAGQALEETPPGLSRAGRLAILEGQPPMTLTPASFRAEFDTMAQVAVTTVSRPMIYAVHDVLIVTRDLKGMTGWVREQREQRLWVIVGSALGLLTGVTL